MVGPPTHQSKSFKVLKSANITTIKASKRACLTDEEIFRLLLALVSLNLTKYKIKLIIPAIKKNKETKKLMKI